MRRTYPIRQTKCGTCPFRVDSPYAALAADITMSALTEASRICHSTGSNGIHRRTGVKPHLCRGARDNQLQVMAAMMVIGAPTDEAWNEARVRIGMKPQIVSDP